MSRAGLWTDWTRRLRASWSAGAAEYGPRLGPGGSTSIPGLFAVGGLAGAGSLAEALEGAGRVSAHMGAEAVLRGAPAPDGTRDLIVVGGGAAGFAAALAARSAGLDCEIVEACEPLVRPAGDPAFPPGDPLLADLRARAAGTAFATRIARAERVERADGWLRVLLAGDATLTARRVILATGRAGCPRRLALPGEDLDHVFHRLHDPADFAGRRAIIVGGGQCSALAAIALAERGAEVTLLYRGAVLTRPRYETLSRLSELLAGAPTEPFRRGRPRGAVPRRAPGPGTVGLRLMTRLIEIRPGEALLGPADGPPEVVPADVVLVLVGRDPDDRLLERSDVAMRGQPPPAH